MAELRKDLASAEHAPRPYELPKEFKATGFKACMEEQVHGGYLSLDRHPIDHSLQLT